MTAPEEWWGKWSEVISNTVEPEPEDPTQTEMVKRLLEKGWTMTDGLRLIHPTKSECYNNISTAYRKAFPLKKRIEIEMWICSFCKRTGRTQDDFGCHHRDPKVKGTAVFLVEESQ